MLEGGCLVGWRPGGQEIWGKAPFHLSDGKYGSVSCVSHGFEHAVSLEMEHLISQATACLDAAKGQVQNICPASAWPHSAHLGSVSSHLKLSVLVGRSSFLFKGGPAFILNMLFEEILDHHSICRGQFCSMDQTL